MTLPSFCEKVVSAPAPKNCQKAPIAEGRGLQAVILVEQCTCTCRVGCPSCVLDTCCSEFNDVMDKMGALYVLRVVARQLCVGT